MKKIAVFILSAVLLLGLSLTVYAAEAPDLSKKGSLTLTMVWDAEPLNSGSLTLYRIGNIENKENTYSFALLPQLQDSQLSLENLKDTALPQKLADLALQRELEPITAQIQNGEAVFPELETGLYVLTQAQADACDGFEAIQPFLISLPHWDGNTYIYDWKANPKVELEKTPAEPTTPLPTEPKDPTLPQTGQLNWPVPVMAVSGLMFLLAGGLLLGRKKVDSEG